MYNLVVTVQEYPSVWRVQVTFSLVEGNGKARALGSKEIWLEGVSPSGDALVDALTICRRAMDLELRPNR